MNNILKSKTKITAIIMILIILALIPLAVIFNQKPQEMRQRASVPKSVNSSQATPAVYFTYNGNNPGNILTLAENVRDFSLILQIDPANNPFTVFDIYITLEGLTLKNQEDLSTEFTVGDSDSPFIIQDNRIRFTKTVDPNKTIASISELCRFELQVNENATRTAISFNTSESSVAFSNVPDLKAIFKNLGINSNIPTPTLTPSPTTVPGEPTPIPSGVETGFGWIPNTPEGFVAKIYSIGIGLVGGVSVLFLIYGGYLIATAAGDVEQLNKGKSRIKYALIGLFLAIFAFIFLQTIAYDILKIPGFKIDEVDKP